MKREPEGFDVEILICIERAHVKLKESSKIKSSAAVFARLDYFVTILFSLKRSLFPAFYANSVWT